MMLRPTTGTESKFHLRPRTCQIPNYPEKKIKQRRSLPCQTPQSPTRWGWNAWRRFEPKDRSRSRLTTSATKPGRCVDCTAEPHLAYDCSALALGSLNPYELSIKGPTILRQKLLVLLWMWMMSKYLCIFWRITNACFVEMNYEYPNSWFNDG